MDILVTGELSAVTTPLFEPLTQGHTIAAASSELRPQQLGKKITTFQLSPGDPRFEKIFNSYNFQVVIFFGQQLYGAEQGPSEFQSLATVLKLCSGHDVNQVIYLQQKLWNGPSPQPESDIETMLEGCNNLCQYYRARHAMSVLICSTPSLYGYDEFSSVVGEALQHAQSSSAIHFHAGESQEIGLLSQKDMGELLLRMVENWTTAYETLDIPPADVMTFGELGNLFKQRFPTLRLAFSPSPLSMDVHFSSDAVRREYDWVPVRGLEEELPAVMDAVGTTSVQEKANFWKKCRDFFKRHSFIIKILELILGFALMELLNNVTGTTIQFRYVDFRLLYVVVLGTIHGIKIGIAASALASVSLLAAMIQNHNNWSAVIYDIDTWLPFVFLFLVGSVTGYIKDRMTNENRFLAQEKEQLEEKYILLNEFYASALQNKNKYKTQIMSYRNSFGRLFDITRNLDSTVLDEVFNEALNALEDILDNRSVCIYSCQNSAYGRLIICSKEVSNVISKSLKLSELDQMTPMLRDGEVWVNRDRLAGYPEYAMPIYHEGRFIALITLQTATYDQLATYYENLIKIVCGLFKISLVHAIEYSDMVEDEMYLPGTRVMTYEYFSKIIRVKESMEQKGVSEYTLLHFNTTPLTRDALANKITTVIRNTDVLGLGKDGDLYLALSQTNETNVKYVLKRLESIGISFSDQMLEESI